MGAKRSTSYSFGSLFKACFSGGSSGSRYHDNWEGSGRGRRIFASDEDHVGFWVAEPDIDRKASDFIARHYATQLTYSERQFAP